MAPPILKLDDIFLSFGGAPLLAGAALQVEPGDRICLVGRNGSGKSTLLKIAAGMVEAQSGEVFRHPSATVRYLEQAPDFAGYKTVAAYAEAGLGPGDDPYRVTYLLSHLGLTGEEDPNSLSGGEARRAALARVLAPEPDILLLDEPTNHLDLPTIEWLEGELQKTRSALVLISHDRRFLEKVSTATVWLDRGTSRRLDQGFGAFEAWRDQVLEAEELEQHKLGKAIEREEHWLRYGVTARRKRNMRRLGELQGMRARYRGHKGPQGSVQASASDAQESGKLVIEAEKITKSYGDRTIVAPFSIRVHRGDCIGLVGPNGAGKTTLLKMLTGQLAPDSGHGEARHQSGNRDPRPEARRPQSGGDARPLPDRRSRGKPHRQRRAAPCHRLHEGIPLPAGAGTHADQEPLGRRACPADAGAHPVAADQPPDPRRADKRPRYRNAGPVAGNRRWLHRHGHSRQPRPRFSRPHRDLDDRAGQS